MKKGTEKTIKNTFYKTNPRGGISLIVLVITIIVVIILAAAVIISLQNNNPMVEANKARINSDVANMQAIFTNTVGKVMAENQDVVTIVGGQLYTTPTGEKKTEGEATYQIMGADGTAVVEGKIKFSAGEKSGRTYYTGKELPLYGSDTKWSVDNHGLLSVEVGGILYGEGAQVEEEGEKIIDSDNPIIKADPLSTIIGNTYTNKITKIKFVTVDKVPINKIESWDISNDGDRSVMAWVEDDGVEGYILTIASKSKVIANTSSINLFYKFNKLKEIENIERLDTSNVTNMAGMFQGCNSLIGLDLSSFDTSKVTYMSQMFLDCNSLKSLNVSSFNVSNVYNMNFLFGNCSSLENLNLENFDTSATIYMGSMFSGCNNLKSLNLSEKFYIGGAKKRDNMFYNCNNLTTTLTLKNNSVGISYTDNSIFSNAATIAPAQITLNYSQRQLSRVNDYITKFPESNIVKGVQVD